MEGKEMNEGMEGGESEVEGEGTWSELRSFVLFFSPAQIRFFCFRSIPPCFVAQSTHSSKAIKS